MFGFLQDLTERLRNNRNERLKRISESGDRMRQAMRGQKEPRETTPSSLTQKMRERTEHKREALKQKREEMREYAKKPRSRVFKIVEYVTTAVAVIPALIIVKMEIWPGPAIREMLKGIGLRGEFFTYFLVALVFYILLLPPRIFLVKTLEKKYPQQEEENPPRY